VSITTCPRLALARVAMLVPSCLLHDTQPRGLQTGSINLMQIMFLIAGFITARRASYVYRLCNQKSRCVYVISLNRMPSKECGYRFCALPPMYLRPFHVVS